MKNQLASPHDVAQDDADAREFDAYARTQDAAELQAALWASRRHDGLDAAAEAEFQQWLAADPVHGELYDELDGSLDGVRLLPGDSIQSLRATVQEDARARVAAVPPRRAPSPASRGSPASPGRRNWLLDLGRLVPQAALAGTAVAVVGGGWLGWAHWRGQPIFEKHYATARGQSLNIDHREVRLLDGQAMFIVSSNAAQPFHVLAGETRVVVVGTRFSVRHTRSGIDAGKTTVAVESGRVRVSALASVEGAGVELTAGQGVTADDAGRLAPVVEIAAGGVAAWRQGRVSFTDTPLAQALAEFERYGDTGLVVRDPAVGALRLGGSFSLRELGTFAQALPVLLPVRLERRGGATEVVALP